LKHSAGRSLVIKKHTFNAPCTDFVREIKTKILLSVSFFVPGGITLSVRVIETAEVMSFKILPSGMQFPQKKHV